MEADYQNMIEVPVQSFDVVVKPQRRRKKDVKEEVIKKVNGGDALTEAPAEDIGARKSSFKKISAFFGKKPRAEKSGGEAAATKPNNIKKSKKRVEETDNGAVSVKSSRFDIVSVQVVAIFALVIGIILTNIFWEDSGINNLLRTVFKSGDAKNTATYQTFNPTSPCKTGEVTLEAGVMHVNSGSIYTPCDGVVKTISEADGKYTVTVEHSDSFSSVISGLDYCYAKQGESVYSSVALGYSGDAVSVSMFNGSSLITSYELDGDKVVWKD